MLILFSAPCCCVGTNTSTGCSMKSDRIYSNQYFIRTIWDSTSDNVKIVSCHRPRSGWARAMVMWQTLLFTLLVEHLICPSCPFSASLSWPCHRSNQRLWPSNDRVVVINTESLELLFPNRDASCFCFAPCIFKNLLILCATLLPPSRLMTLSCSLSLTVTEGLLTGSCSFFSSSSYRAAAISPRSIVISLFSEGKECRCRRRDGKRFKPFCLLLNWELHISQSPVDLKGRLMYDQPLNENVIVNVI